MAEIQGKRVSDVMTKISTNDSFNHDLKSLSGDLLDFSLGNAQRFGLEMRFDVTSARLQDETADFVYKQIPV